MVGAKELLEYSKDFTLLYAEDEAMLRESMHATLSRFFKKVYVAKDGFEAFDIFEREQIDILLTDISMPILSGVSLIDKIHAATDTPPPIIVLSAHDESAILIKLINKGIDKFLNKPVNKERMIDTFYKVCKGLHDAKNVVRYNQELQAALKEMELKNRALEKKLTELAQAKNRMQPKEKRDVAKTTSNENYFETLHPDDRDELEELSDELYNFINALFADETINTNFLQNVIHVYHKYGSILIPYAEFSEIGLALETLSRTIQAHTDKLLEDQQSSAVYFESFFMTLENFREHVWNNEAANPRFYNASLISDLATISDFLEGVEHNSDDIEFF